MHAELTRPDTEIPLHFVKEGVPLLMAPVKVNGQGPFDFIIDTGNGAKALIISQKLATQLGIQTKEKVVKTEFPVGFSKKFSIGKIDSFHIGKEALGVTEVAVAPALDELADKLKANIDGNIGYGFLKNYAMTLDFKRSTLELSHDSPKGDSVPFEIGGSKPLIVVEVIADGKPLHFALDTGASYCCLSPQAATELGLKLGAEHAVNGSADHKSYLSKLKSLRVGGREQHDVGVAVADFLDDLTKAMGRQIDGVLGYTFWSKYRLTIDYRRKRLLLGDPQ